MKLFLTTCLLLSMAIYAKTQTVDFYGKEVAKDICNQYGMKDDKEAKECLDKICDAASIPNNFVLAPCTNIDNCFALYKNGYSYIVYDINFFNKIKTFGFTEKNLPKNNVDWAALTILAHEIGHHMCLHTTNPNLSSIYTPVQIELQADEYAGSVMYKLGATLTQAQLAMNNSDVPEEASLTHPGRSARLEAIAKGWDKEYKKNAARNGQVINNLQPAAGLQGMVLIEGGIFNMGSDNGNANEKPVHSATVNSFYMGKYEVTVAEFKKFVAATGYTTAAEKEGKSWVWDGSKWEEKNGINWHYDAVGNKLTAGQDNQPVIHVNWDDCIKILPMDDKAIWQNLPVAHRGGMGICCAGREQERWICI